MPGGRGSWLRSSTRPHRKIGEPDATWSSRRSPRLPIARNDVVTLDVNLATSFMASAEDAERLAANAPITLRLAEAGRDPVALNSALVWFSTSRMVLGDFEGARPGDRALPGTGPHLRHADHGAKTRRTSAPV